MTPTSAFSHVDFTQIASHINKIISLIQWEDIDDIDALLSRVLLEIRRALNPPSEDIYSTKAIHQQQNDAYIFDFGDEINFFLLDLVPGKNAKIQSVALPVPLIERLHESDIPAVFALSIGWNLSHLSRIATEDDFDVIADLFKSLHGATLSYMSHQGSDTDTELDDIIGGSIGRLRAFIQSMGSVKTVKKNAPNKKKPFIPKRLRSDDGSMMLHLTSVSKPHHSSFAT